MKSARASLLAAGFLLTVAAPVPAEELGRLFFSPERRAALDRLRQYNIQETARENFEDTTLSVTGIVRRSSGRDTAWINNAPQNLHDTGSGVQIELDRRNHTAARVAVGDEMPAWLKVGETLNRTTRETKSGLGEGRIVVKRGKAN